MQRVYFPIRPECLELSKGLRTSFVENVERDSWNVKVTSLMDEIPNMLDEMDANWELKSAIIPITPTVLSTVKDFSTLVGLMINLVYLLYATRKYHYREMIVDQWVEDVIKILGYI